MSESEAFYKKMYIYSRTSIIEAIYFLSDDSRARVYNHTSQCCHSTGAQLHAMPLESNCPIYIYIISGPPEPVRLVRQKPDHFFCVYAELLHGFYLNMDIDS